MQRRVRVNPKGVHLNHLHAQPPMFVTDWPHRRAIDSSAQLGGDPD
jgi:hypothetical protein